MSKKISKSVMIHVQQFTKVFSTVQGDVCVQREYTGGQKERRMSKGDVHKTRQIAKLMALGLTYDEACADIASE